MMPVRLSYDGKTNAAARKVYKIALAYKLDSCYTEKRIAIGKNRGGMSCSRKFFVHCWHP
jgi:hypothetical protein